jgi:hypothetical protein
MARPKKKEHSSSRHKRRGDKPVQVWFTQADREKLLHAAAICGRPVANLVHAAAIRATTRIIEANKNEPGLAGIDERS